MHKITSMNLFRNGSALLICLLIGLHVNSQSSKSIEAAISRSQFLAEETLKKNNLPSLSIAVAIDGKLIWKEAFGFADIEQKIKADPDFHQYRIGSISKSITATALGQLKEEGKLNFDDPIQKHVSYFPEKRFPITIRNVAGHLSGIRHYKGFEFFSNKHYTDIKSTLDVFKADSLLSQPGSKYSYSSYGWNLLSAVVEEASSSPFLEYMHKQIFTPLQMQQTVADDKTKMIDGRTQYYNNKSGNLVIAGEVDLSVKYAGGGFLSTAPDLIKFAQSYYDRTLLKKATINEMWQPMKLNNGKINRYGIGWRQGSDQKNRKWVGHSGGSVGGTSRMFLFPEKEMIIVILCNQSSANLSDLSMKIANQFFYEEK